MRPEQICLLPHLSAPSVHPDGTWVVVSMTHPNFEADDRVGQLWRIALGAGPGPTAPGTGSRRITRGFAEMTRLGVALGGRAETVAGLCGLGDLVLTCSSPQSRNMSLGLALGQGQTIDQALAGKRSVAEGYESAPAVRELA